MGSVNTGGAGGGEVMAGSEDSREVDGSGTGEVGAGWTVVTEGNVEVTVWEGGA